MAQALARRRARTITTLGAVAGGVALTTAAVAGWQAWLGTGPLVGLAVLPVTGVALAAQLVVHRGERLAASIGTVAGDAPRRSARRDAGRERGRALARNRHPGWRRGCRASSIRAGPVLADHLPRSRRAHARRGPRRGDRCGAGLGGGGHRHLDRRPLGDVGALHARRDARRARGRPGGARLVDPHADATAHRRAVRSGGPRGGRGRRRARGLPVDRRRRHFARPLAPVVGSDPIRSAGSRHERIRHRRGSRSGRPLGDTVPSPS